MKVLVAGATGAIGRPLVSALLATGHEVIGMSRSENGARSLREKGAEGEVANALDENAVLALMRRVKPDAVIDELTWLPSTMPSLPSTRPNGSRERRSSAFIRED